MKFLKTGFVTIVMLMCSTIIYAACTEQDAEDAAENMDMQKEVVDPTEDDAGEARFYATNKQLAEFIYQTNTWKSPDCDPRRIALVEADVAYADSQLASGDDNVAEGDDDHEYAHTQELNGDDAFEEENWCTAVSYYESAEWNFEGAIQWYTDAIEDFESAEYWYGEAILIMHVDCGEPMA